ncbi:hypothetical protein [Chryseobacterium potabilaquae]|uniref:Lipoprotein n=1 Tax=Chryseobacterium potabilaquae TaxID=2675057 RepID=A0A6N4X6K1_9FLAO|nr:hypothetical protein [Chryseobacterium potabilaquae]CAA7195200.1 hypothetical protein CHRY9293_01431 [Chryseobacterium potabilaquae]
MKTKISSLLIVILLLSCGSNPQNYFNNLLDNVQIGMSESDFKSKVQDEQLVKSDQNVSIYKVEKRTYNDLHGWRSDHRFFYFINNKLSQIDQGERAVDYRIKVD